MSALSLDKRTQLHQSAPTGLSGASYEGFRPPLETLRSFVVRDFGQGVVEVGYTRCPAIDEPVRPPDVQTQKDLPFDSQKRRKRLSNNLNRSIRRSKSQFRRKCMAGNLDYLLTLTYKENKTDLDDCWKDFKRFIRLVQNTHKGWKYCAIPEFQKRGAVHFHVAVSGFQNVRLLRSLWLQVVGEGNIDIRAPKQSIKSKWSLVSLALYLTKYLTKDMVIKAGRQRYRVSEGIAVPVKRVLIRSPKGFDVVQSLFDSLGIALGFRWDDENFAHGWACSWK